MLQIFPTNDKDMSNEVNQDNEIVEFFKNRERPYLKFPLSLVSKKAPQWKTFRLRVLTESEKEKVLLSANKRCKEKNIEDKDLVDTYRSCSVLANAMGRDSDDGWTPVVTADFILQHLTQDELNVLASCYGETLRILGPGELLNADLVDALFDVCQADLGTDANEMLLRLSREALTELCIRFAKRSKHFGTVEKPKDN